MGVDYIMTKKSNSLDEKDPDSISVNNSASSSSPKVEWSPENEAIMVEWCDVAQCYKWLNTKAHDKYSSKNAWMTIPIIILSTISGTASFAQASLPLEYQVYAPMIIGTINIGVGIMSTIQQYLKISELNEAHRVAAISWDKYARNIRIELAKDPNERMDAGQFIKINRQEFDRLMETSPSIPPDIVVQFNRVFRDMEGFNELKKPDICNIIISAEKYRHNWYKEVGKSTYKHDDLLSANATVSQQAEIIRENSEYLKRRHQEELLNFQKNQELHNRVQKEALEHMTKMNAQIRVIDEYVATFYGIYERRPLTEEITDHFSDKDIDKAILQDYLNKYTLEDNIQLSTVSPEENTLNVVKGHDNV